MRHHLKMGGAKADTAINLQCHAGYPFGGDEVFNAFSNFRAGPNSTECMKPGNGIVAVLRFGLGE